MRPLQLFLFPAGRCLVLLDFCVFLLRYMHPSNLDPAVLMTVSVSLSETLPSQHMTEPHVVPVTSLLAVAVYLSTLFPLTISVSAYVF